MIYIQIKTRLLNHCTLLVLVQGKIYKKPIVSDNGHEFNNKQHKNEKQLALI